MKIYHKRGHPFKILAMPMVKNWAKTADFTMLKLLTWEREGSENGRPLSVSTQVSNIL